MDFYTAILNKGGKIIQDGSAWRDILSEDGTKIIRQIAQKNGGCAIDVFQKTDEKNIPLIYSFRKIIKPDGKSYFTKSFNYKELKGQIQSVLKLEKEGSFMQTLIKTNQAGQINPSGDFFSKAENQIKKGKVTFFPIGNKINPNNPAISVFTNTFNKLFGKLESKIF